MQITPKLLTLVKIFDSLNHSFNFYWQNNDSKNIHSKKNLIIHSSKIFIQKKKKLFIQKKIHSKKKLSIHSKKIFIQKFFWLFIQWKYSFFWKMPYRPPLGGGGSIPFHSFWGCFSPSVMCNFLAQSDQFNNRSVQRCHLKMENHPSGVIKKYW